MLTCSCCQWQVTDEDRYCPNCGMCLSEQTGAPPEGAARPAESTASPDEAQPAFPGGKCPSCNTDNMPGSLFCEVCGQPLAPPAAAVQPAASPLACPTCGAENMAGSAFCEVCGQPLTATPAPDEDTPPAGKILPAEAAPEVERPSPEATPASPPSAEQEATLASAHPPGKCPTCGTPNLPDSAFCQVCGEPLAAQAAQPAQPAPPSPSPRPASQPRPQSQGACPTCGKTNAAEDAFCWNCGEPLSASAVPPAPLPQPAFSAEIPSRPRPALLVPGSCPTCGQINPEDSLFCENCGEALKPTAEPPPIPSPASAASAAAPTEVPPTKPMQPDVLRASGTVFGRLVVQTTRAEIILPLGKKEIILGRTDPVRSIFPDVDTTPHGGDKSGVSRRHARLTAQDKQLFIEDMGSTNFTYLNQQKLQPGQPVALNDGDTIRLGWLVMVYHAS